MNESVLLYSDLDLLELIRQGDKKGLEMLFKRYYQPLCRFAELILKDEHLCEDLVQENFIKLWENRSSLNMQHPKAYLYKTIKNGCLNQLDVARRTELLSDAEDNSSHASYNSDAVLVTGELKDEIDVAINSLPAQCKLIFQLSRQEEMTYREIAEHLGISIKTVENQMSKALQLLRNRLQHYLNDTTLGILLGTCLLNQN